MRAPWFPSPVGSEAPSSDVVDQGQCAVTAMLKDQDFIAGSSVGLCVHETGRARCLVCYGHGRGQCRATAAHARTPPKRRQASDAHEALRKDGRPFIIAISL